MRTPGAVYVPSGSAAWIFLYVSVSQHRACRAEFRIDGGGLEVVTDALNPGAWASATTVAERGGLLWTD